MSEWLSIYTACIERLTANRHQILARLRYLLRIYFVHCTNSHTGNPILSMTSTGGGARPQAKFRREKTAKERRSVSVENGDQSASENRFLVHRFIGS